MSKLVLLDARLFVAGADLSGSGNKIELSEEWEAKTVTNWRSGGAEELLGGLGKVQCSASGQWEAGDPGLVDDAFWAGRRAIEPWSASGTGESDLSAGNLMYLTRMLRTKAQYWGEVGDVASWDADAVGSWPLVRGVNLHSSGVPRTATGFGTAFQVGAVLAGRSVYANLHVIGIAGTATPSIAVTVQSDNAIGFPSPTTVATFATRTTKGGESIRVPGPNTDDWWRVGYTITGTTPSFLFLVTMGIE
jgi:hypothetical protein